MLWTIAVVLLILWALGMVSSYTLGGFIHLLLVLALIVVLIRVIQGRRPVLKQSQLHNRVKKTGGASSILGKIYSRLLSK